MEPSRSALIVAVAEAEPVVAAHRDRLDLAASWGVPAHITICYPFLPPADLDEQVLAGLRRVAAAVPAFFCKLTEVSWFGERVVWLAPDPAEPFRALTAAGVARFPAARPYAPTWITWTAYSAHGTGWPATVSASPTSPPPRTCR